MTTEPLAALPASVVPSLITSPTITPPTSTAVEDKLRAAMVWAKENSYIPARRNWYGKYCDNIRAILLQNSKQDVLSVKSLVEVAGILNVNYDWVRAFMYGFDGCAPRLLGREGDPLEQPKEAYQLGLKLAEDSCGPPAFTY